jgi:UDP-N-acetylglucosamine transferase subunit ALG13
VIFVTIGAQIPFNRLIETIDEIAPSLNEPVVAQTMSGTYRARNLETMPFLPPDEFNRLFAEARLIVSHAGMGNIISALKLGKPIIIFPRLASLGEHRNDHQMATAMRMNELGYVYVAYDKTQLKALLLRKDLKPLRQTNHCSCNLLDAIIESIG